MHFIEARPGELSTVCIRCSPKPIAPINPSSQPPPKNRARGNAIIATTPQPQGSTTLTRLAREVGWDVAKLRRVLKSLGVDVHSPFDPVTTEQKGNFLDWYERYARRVAPNPVAAPRPPSIQRSCIYGSSLEYDWPRVPDLVPFKHQIKTTEFLVSHSRAFCLNDMGTGKTLSVLWAFDYLRHTGAVKSMLVVCPLSTMLRTWGDELNANFKGILRYKILHGGDSRFRLQALSEPANVYIINPAGLRMKRIQDALANRPDIGLVVVDEIAQSARTPGTETYKALMAVINGKSKRIAWGLTGAPIPNDPTDVWGQCRVLGLDTVPIYFNRFKQDIEFRREKLGKPRFDRNCREITHVLYPRSREETIQLAFQAMQPSIRYVRDECIDLPPLVTETLQIDMSGPQVRAYREMLATLWTEYEDGEISASNELVKANKLLQIACGVPYTVGGGSVTFPIEDRLSAVEDVIDNANSKVIVFVSFVKALDTVANYLKRRFAVEVIYGDTPLPARDRIIHDFQKKESPHVLVANPASMSHGITLTAASTIVWFSPIWSNDITLQANCRITRPGQKNAQLIVNIQGSPIERKVYARLKEKGRVQGLLLEMLADKASWYEMSAG